ncbi:4-oxalocrotonate tautomerase family protein [Campylobacter coli]|nr:4-oxalocrotonate tautomerase family protein [Campylobacter coli]EDO7786172.1 2-hydroxymuconate tautomerase family protein [Campylobacter coli]EEP6780811.1 4-oxalocrotonate tautomerase family protein [Campylobacter coli]EFB5674033.1 4-oxalocrotonate tautomerase family protein [Campylobacter coli]
MPFVNIRITKENGEPTSEQKQELIAGVTDLLTKVLNKNKASTVVIIDEIDTDNYGLGGKSITRVRKEKS